MLVVKTCNLQTLSSSVSLSVCSTYISIYLYEPVLNHAYTTGTRDVVKGSGTRIFDLDLDLATYSLFKCPFFGTCSWFRKAILLLALFCWSLHAHFKNSVTHVRTAYANPAHARAQMHTHHDFIEWSYHSALYWSRD